MNYVTHKVKPSLGPCLENAYTNSQSIMEFFKEKFTFYKVAFEKDLVDRA